MADVIVLIGTAWDTLKKLKEVSDKLKDADTKNLIADLSIALADLKVQVADLKNENLRLAEELARKKSHEEQAGQLIVKDAVLYFREPPAGKPAGPYCPNCKENGNRLVLIKDNRGTPFQKLATFTCPQCKSKF